MKITEQNQTEKGIEELFSQIEDIISDMEGADVSLEQAFSLYQQGIALVRQCNGKIDRVEKEIQILNQKSGEEDEDELS